jgi:hypothetical protein
MAANLTRLTHKIAIQLHLVAESCTICSSRSRRPVRKLLDTLSTHTHTHTHTQLSRSSFKSISSTNSNNCLQGSFINWYLTKEGTSTKTHFSVHSFHYFCKHNLIAYCCDFWVISTFCSIVLSSPVTILFVRHITALQ